MAMIMPTEGKGYDRDPEEGNYPTGMYVCVLTRVDEIDPSAKFPDGNRRLVFEFTLDDPNFPQFKGKKCAAFVGKTVFKSPKDGKESKLVTLARMMGVKEPEKGFDPDTLIGKKYHVMSEHLDGRSWARQAVAIAGQPASPPPAAPPQQQPTPAASPTAEAEESITNAATLDALKFAWQTIYKTVWATLTADQQAALEKKKDERKVQLLAPPDDRIPF
jgi:hypothetical protein